MPEIVVERVQQHIIEKLDTDLSFIPERVRRWFIDNVFRRSLSYLVAFTEQKIAQTLRCTADGKLKVAVSGVGYTDYEEESGDAENTYAVADTFEFEEAWSVWDILIEDNGAEISFKKETAVWGDAKPLPIGMYSIDFSAYGIKVQNRAADSVAKYSITRYK